MIEAFKVPHRTAASSAVEKVRSWVLDEAMPLWVRHGINSTHGGPVEVFALDDDPQPLAAPMRTRVTGRQLYAFSHAHLMGVPDSLAAADQMFDFLRRRIWLGAEKGWCRTLSSAGQPLDLQPDLYDFSFCLFGLAWYYEATGSAQALSLALQTLEIVERDFRHPSGMGYHNALPGMLPRQQNPHMHLLEAVLKLNAVAPSQQLSSLASELVALFSDKFFSCEYDCLPEFFTSDLEPLREATGCFRFEPGHQFEWAWILAQHQKQSGADHSDLIRRLVAGAEQLGVSQTSGLTFNAVATNGAVLDPGSRTWPNTERIKGWLGLSEVTGEDPWKKVESACDTLFKYHLGPGAPRGLWHDTISEQGLAITDTVPASTLYHLLLAFSEILRLYPAQENSTRSCEK
ncbi:N-acylglucosamine 2-epimerase [Hyphomonas neptunium ATCC 15444]|uniref:N-acylglucosamine 2-epimerase n=2 Tax=Hyphomonas TaxID=85 RepID=Q0C433_HYPNA|nr:MULTISPECIES: AGE family epimerase/isomerase [Hyphomonas]ABI75526.1 N-acylglucosamine 2-epimerase [Hyphomonas neptunium ATCC 15444]KCZ96278.1 N-acylglucosamine 2-epimerase [Hyphomonas hirschiana VP5]